MKITMARTRKVRIEMLPLIDIVFLLLVFFIYAMLSMAVHRGMPVELPASSAAAPGKELFLSVTIQNGAAEGEPLVFVDEERVGLADLETYLRLGARNKAGQANPGVLLFADRDVSYQQLFQVLDLISRAGLSQISLQAEAVR